MKALDLFCGAGGVALGLIAAGYDVVGVDIDRRCGKVYPGRFILGDATNPPVRLDGWDLVWASPPCQAFSVAVRPEHKKGQPDYIAQTRQILAASGCDRTVIENVPLAPIRPDVVLTGPMVGLPRILRRRHFELNWWPGLLHPVLPRTERKPVTILTSDIGERGRDHRKGAYWWKRYSVAEGREFMGIDLPFTRRQLGESVPPAYARYIAELALHAP